MGRPKAWLPIGDEVMLQRVVRTLRAVVEPVVVVAAPGQDIPVLPAEVCVVRDKVEGMGPLAGLASGLDAITSVADAVYLSSCDVPFLKPVFVQRVIERLADYSVAVPRVDGFYHPLAAVYRIDVAPKVRELLSSNKLRPMFLFDTVPTRVVEPHDLTDIDPVFASLRNVNTPEDYEAVLRDIRR